MDEVESVDDLIACHRKEKKELLAKVQKMKHGVPKGDKKKKKEVALEIAQLLSEMDLKHEEEIKEFEAKYSSSKSCDVHQPSEIEKLSSEAENQEEKCVSNHVNSLHNNASGAESAEFSDVPKLSKAQRRRNKKALIEKERAKAIAEQEKENLTGIRNSESQEIKKKLSNRNLTIHEIASDGNCLYKAVEHQLSVLNLKVATVESLRKSISQHMLSYKEDYIPFLTCPETGDVLTEEKYVKYCEDIAETTAWGGHVEVQALSRVCGLPIEVIQAQGPSVIVGDESSTTRIILSYHRHFYGLGEHYNSVIPASTVD